MNRRNDAMTELFILISFLGLAFSGCSTEQRAESPAPELVGNVSVTVAQRVRAPDWREAVGNVRAVQTSQVSSQMIGAIVEIRTREGDRVQSSQVLAVIDDAQPRSGVEQATAAEAAAEKVASAADSDFTLAEATLRRYQQLYEKKSVSPQEFDEIKARYQSATARRETAHAEQARAAAALTQARTLLGYTRIRAPFAGVVTAKNADGGMLASPGMPIFTVEDTRRYRLEVSVDESDIRLVRPGQPVPVLIDAIGHGEFSGKVGQIVPAADPASRTFLVKVELPSDSRLRSGLFGRARFSSGESSSLLIPHSAVVERGQLQGVYVVDANRIAELRYVTLGKVAGQQVEVLSGLVDGEWLIDAPADRELSGKRIATQQ